MSTPLSITLNGVNNLASTIQTLFTAPLTGNGVLIDAFTATNTSDINASYTAYITAATGTVENPQRPDQIVVHGEQDLGGGLTNQLIPPGGRLSMETTAADSIYFTVTGRIV